jgi:hypothetical protein
MTNPDPRLEQTVEALRRLSPVKVRLLALIADEMLREASVATEGSLRCAGTSTRCVEWRP